MQSTYKQRLFKERKENLKEDLKTLFWVILGGTLLALALLHIHKMIMTGLDIMVAI